MNVEAANSPEKMLVYIGTYTGGASKGIYLYEFATKDGSLRPLGLVAESPSPSFLAIHPNKKFLYAVNELGEFEGQKAGSVSAFAIQDDGKLKPLNTVTSGGVWPCHIVTDAAGKNVLLANYGGGNVEVVPIKADGSLGKPSALVQHEGSSVNKDRQGEPHAHSINLDKNNRFAVAADLGTDSLYVYKYDAQSGKLEANDPPAARLSPGAGPRHFAFDPTGRRGYVINELDCTITGFDYSAERGTLKEFQTISTLGNESFQNGYSTAEVQVHPSGKFVYGSNRGHNTIAAYKVNPATGKLSFVETESTQGKTPRNFGIDPTGKYLIAANQDSDSLVVFRINQDTGALEPAGVKVESPKPVCVKFLVK